MPCGEASHACGSALIWLFACSARQDLENLQELPSKSNFRLETRSRRACLLLQHRSPQHILESVNSPFTNHSRDRAIIFIDSSVRSLLCSPRQNVNLVNMVDKRKPTSETPRSAESSHKRRKVTDAGSPPAATPTRPGQPNLTESEKEKLKAFLDSKAKASGIAFPIQYLQPRLKKGRKGHKETKTPAAIVEEQLSLGGQSYGRVRYVVQNRPKWEQLTRYKKCSGKDTLLYALQNKD